MGKELDNYREILESILAYTNGAHLLNKTSVGKYLGVGKTTVNNLGIGANGITAEALARKLAEL